MIKLYRRAFGLRELRGDGFAVILTELNLGLKVDVFDLGNGHVCDLGGAKIGWGFEFKAWG